MDDHESPGKIGDLVLLANAEAAIIGKIAEIALIIEKYGPEGGAL